MAEVVVGGEVGEVVVEVGPAPCPGAGVAPVHDDKKRANTASTARALPACLTSGSTVASRLAHRYHVRLGVQVAIHAFAVGAPCARRALPQTPRGDQCTPSLVCQSPTPYAQIHPCVALMNVTFPADPLPNPAAESSGTVPHDCPPLTVLNNEALVGYSQAVVGLATARFLCPMENGAT